MNSEMLTLDIRQRERELHEMQDLRIGQLESEITKRDNLIIEVSKRYTQLQEDFKYNLGLITARDMEINRLDEAVKSRTTDFESADSENRSLHIKIETMESTYAEREKAWEQEKQANKELLREVKGLCDQMQYKHDEDIRALNREIDYLRLEAQRSAVARDECLESQRKDLIDTYEGIMHHNEVAHQKKVDEISSQIEKLGTRIEQMQTESLKMKSDLTDSHRFADKLNAELAAAEEARRQLKWQLDDERSSKTVADDTLQRQLLSVQLELASSKEALNKDIEELKKTNEKLLLDAQREKEFRNVVEKRLEEAKIVFQHDRQLLLVEINEFRVHETMLQNEITSLREERDSSLNRGASLRLEVESMDVRVKNLLKESDLLRGELSAERSRVSEGDGKLTKLAQEFQQYREDVREKEYKSMQSAADQILENKNTTYEEVRVLREMHESEMKRLQQRQAMELQQVNNELSEKVEELQSKLLRGTTEAARLQESLDEAQRSSAAVQMRLDIKEESITRLNKEVKELEARQQSYLRSLQQQQQQYQGGGGGGGGTVMGGQLDMSHLDLNQSLDFGGGSTGQGPLSPAFSTDLGAIPSISFPNSPMPSYLNNNNNNRFRMLDGQSSGAAGGGGGGRLGAQQVLSSTQYISLQAKYDQAVVDLDLAVQARDQLAGENEKLKNNIKEMREILEHLKSDSDHQQKTAQSQLVEKDDQLASMEVQIDKMVDECNRLRSESKRLMDTCNELRATNNQLSKQLQGGVNTSGPSSLPLASTPMRGGAVSGAAHTPSTAAGYTNLFDYVTSSPSVVVGGGGGTPLSPSRRLQGGAAPFLESSAHSYFHPNNGGGSFTPGYQPGLAINTALAVGASAGAAVSPKKNHISTVDQYHKVWGNLTYGRPSTSSTTPNGAGGAAAGPLSPKPVVTTIPNNNLTTVRGDADEYSTASHYAEALGFSQLNNSSSTAAAPPASDTDELDSLDPRHQQEHKKRASIRSSGSSKPTRRHTVAAPLPPPPPSAASKLFQRHSDDSEPDADIIPMSSSSGTIGMGADLNLTGHSIRASSFTSSGSGGSGPAVAAASAPSAHHHSFVNRGVSVFHKSGLPVPISNSDRETTSQTRALSSLKTKTSAASTTSAAAPPSAVTAKGVRRNSTMSSVPQVRNYALGDEGDTA